MRDFAEEAGLLPPHIASGLLIEEFARDSFENLFFSLLAYYKHFGCWPDFVGVVSLTAKALRFAAIACGLALGGDQFQFYCSGGNGRRGRRSPGDPLAGEGAYIAMMVDLTQSSPQLIDPLHRDPEKFGRKRLPDRTPREYWRDATGAPTHNQIQVDYAATEHAYLNAVRTAYRREPHDAAERLIDAVEQLGPYNDWRTVSLWPWNPHAVPSRRT